MERGDGEFDVGYDAEGDVFRAPDFAAINIDLDYLAGLSWYDGAAAAAEEEAGSCAEEEDQVGLWLSCRSEEAEVEC